MADRLARYRRTVDLDSIIAIFGILFWLAVIVWLARFAVEAVLTVRARRQGRRDSNAL